MREVIADFARLNQRPEFAGESIPLGTERIRPELGEFSDGQRVLLVEPGNLRAEGMITIRVVDGVRYYYGVVTGSIVDDAA